VGWVAWLGIHLTFLTGFKNRFAALAEWTTAFLGRYRCQRTITAQQVFARECALTAQSDEDRTGDVHHPAV
jgi:NADH dehydrogenase